MAAYITTLAQDFKTNEVAQGLVLVAFAFTVVFGGLIVISTVTTGVFAVGNSLTLPLVFAGAALAHFLARPAVLLHYAKK